MLWEQKVRSDITVKNINEIRHMEGGIVVLMFTDCFFSNLIHNWFFQLFPFTADVANYPPAGNTSCESFWL